MHIAIACYENIFYICRLIACLHTVCPFWLFFVLHDNLHKYGCVRSLYLRTLTLPIKSRNQYIIYQNRKTKQNRTQKTYSEWKERKKENYDTHLLNKHTLNDNDDDFIKFVCASLKSLHRNFDSRKISWNNFEKLKIMMNLDFSTLILPLIFFCYYCLTMRWTEKHAHRQTEREQLLISTGRLWTH